MKRIRNLRFTIGFFVFILFLSGALSVYAPIAEGVPAMPGIRVHTQSDGGVVSYQVIGDEFLNYMIDDNGDLLAFGDDEDLYYAEWISERDFSVSASSFSTFSIIPSGKFIEFVILTNKKPTGRQANAVPLNESDMHPLKTPIPKYILEHVDKGMKERDASFREWRSASPSMTTTQDAAFATEVIERNTLIIYVRFANESNISELQNREIPNASIQNTILNSAIQGSVAHYYRAVTNDVVRIAPARETHGTTNDGIVRVTIPGTHKNWSNNAPLFITDVAIPALREASSFINFRDFTSGSYISGVELSIVFVVHGYESSASNLSPGVWGHAAWGANLGTYNGIRISDYCAIGAFQSKAANPQPFTAGIVAHELGHVTFRFTDLYNLSNNRTRGITGSWSVMGQGSWGASSGEPMGTTPTGLDAYHLSTLYSPTYTVSSANLAAGQQFSLTGVSQFAKLETAFPNQYFLLQSRGNVGYDRGIFRTMSTWPAPYGGLMIYHIDENKSPSVSDVNTIWQTHPFIDIEEAHGGTQHLQNNAANNVGTADDLFFGTRNKFDISTDPNSNLYASNTATTQTVASGVLVSDITPTVTGQNTQGGSVTVTFKVGTSSAPTITTTSLPGGTTGTAYSQTMAATGTTPITWSIPSGSLPTGLSMNAAGQISGTPTVAGTFSFSVRATNSAGNDTKPFSIVINAALVPPIITSPPLPAGTAGTAYSHTMAASGTTPITWAIVSGSLPTGLSMNAAGQISGTPTAAGTFSFSVRATNSAGNDTKPFNIVISAALVPPTITTPLLPTGTVGTPYSLMLAATGTTPISWAITIGNLPFGLTLTAAGLISGTPTAAGTYTLNLRATNGAGNDTKPFSIVISAALVPPTITTPSLPTGRVGTSYSQTLVATGTTPITWAIASGSLPLGLSMNAAGQISGTPTAAGTSSFSVRATNSVGNVTKPFSIVISAVIELPSIITLSLPGGRVGTLFNETLRVSGTTPVTWVVTSGSLPPGLKLNATSGLISGRPTMWGTYNFTIRASSSEGNDSKAFSIVVGEALEAPIIVTTSMSGGVVDTPYNETLKVSGSIPIIWSINSGSLPSGLSLNATTGLISGRPTTVGSFSFSVRATNDAGYATRNLRIIVSAPPIITTTSLPGGIVGKNYSQRLTASGTTPITWSVDSGNLPSGLSLNATGGNVTGTPTSTGTFNFTIRATNVAGYATRSLSIVITALPTITTVSLPGGSLGSAYNQTLTATGTTPITWSINSGRLPAGLVLNETTGLISGTSTALGTSSFTVRATNAAGYAAKSLSIAITALPTITTDSLPDSIVGKTYNQRLVATGTTPITWSIASGSLPSGLSLNATTGYISGAPTTMGTFSFTVGATNVVGITTKGFRIVVAEIPIITTTSLPGCTLGNAYHQTLAATGTTPITWSISSGRLPAGLSLNGTTGIISGAATTLGTSSFTVRATNVAGYASKSLSIAITAPPTITVDSLPGGVVGKTYSQRLAATGTTPITWSVASGSLPSGLSLNATTGVISGTLTTIGIFNFSVRATNAAGDATKNLSIVITAIPAITTPSLPGGVVGISYNQTLAATGTTPIAWSINSGRLPAGLVLNESTGAISGVPTTMGTSSFTVRATNVAGYAAKTLSIVITSLPKITTVSLSGGIVGRNYNQRLTASGTTPITWALASGSLPPGLSLNATTGYITGAPITAGTFNFTIRATNTVGYTSEFFSIVVN